MKSAMYKGIFITIGTGMILSCASTPKTNVNENEKLKESVAAITETAAPSASEVYYQKVHGINLSLTATPKETVKGKIFTSPYVVKVSNEAGEPLESFELSVVYPSSRKTGNSDDSGTVEFTETVITTNSEGLAEFLPPVPEYSFNSEISFFPKIDSAVESLLVPVLEDASNIEIAKISALKDEHTVKAPFAVQTNMKSSGGLIALVDFNQNGRAITSNPISSSNLLMTLMKLGFTRIGNAPADVSDAVISGDESKILSRSKAVSSSMIVFGTVKIDSCEKTDEGFTYTLTALVKSMDLKDGKITFKTEKTVSVTDKNDWNALANARKTIAEQIAHEIKYGI
ncbi:hypothetical protein [uncultured Treponema sp.]|uniref:hypothetical protein n=1 Tax=uncultured Treponema sp. TaxID=162155 RepID=UPI0025E6F660|nr:hypothetical protein [uncultured Treponema sp.]